MQRPRRWLRTLVFAALASAAACSSSSSGGPTTTLSVPDAASDAATVDAGQWTPSPPEAVFSNPGKDEDPSLLRAKDGTFYLAFFSNRDGSDRLYVSTSADGRSWSTPRAITSGSEHAFYPSLIQAADGTFHLVWWQGSLSDAGGIIGTIAYARSADSITWTTPTLLTESSALAWTPTITERVPGELVVVWSSNESGDKDIYVRSSANGGTSWEGTTHLVDNGFNDDLPFVVTRSDGSLLMLWQRYDVTVKAFDAPFGHPSNDLVYATSTDGVAWSNPLAITNDALENPVPDVIGTLYPSDDSSGWSAAWASVRNELPGGNIFSLGLSHAPLFATKPVALTDGAPGGYSPRLVKTDAPGVYLMAWVGANGTVDGGTNLDIFTRLVSP